MTMAFNFLPREEKFFDMFDRQTAQMGQVAEGSPLLGYIAMVLNRRRTVHGGMNTKLLDAIAEDPSSGFAFAIQQTSAHLQANLYSGKDPVNLV